MDEGLLDDYLEGLFDDDLCDITSKDDKKDDSQEIHLHLVPFNGNPKGWEPYHA